MLSGEVMESKEAGGSCDSRWVFVKVGGTFHRTWLKKLQPVEVDGSFHVHQQRTLPRTSTEGSKFYSHERERSASVEVSSLPWSSLTFTEDACMEVSTNYIEFTPIEQFLLLSFHGRECKRGNNVSGRISLSLVSQRPVLTVRYNRHVKDNDRARLIVFRTPFG